MAEPSPKVGTDKPKLKDKMQSVSDDDVWKTLTLTLTLTSALAGKLDNKQFHQLESPVTQK